MLDCIRLKSDTSLQVSQKIATRYEKCHISHSEKYMFGGNRSPLMGSWWQLYNSLPLASSPPTETLEQATPQALGMDVFDLTYLL